MSFVARNSALNVFAFAVASIVGLVLAPLIIGRYGLETFGLLAISRLLLPSGLGGLLDLGLPEATTRMVATDRAGSGATNGWRYCRVALAVTFCIGLVCAAVLWWVAPVLSSALLHVSPGVEKPFELALRWTAVSLVGLFPFGVLEAWIKGKERFALLRATEILQNLAYGAAVVWLINVQSTIFDLVAAYLLLSLAKGFFLVFCLAGSRDKISSKWLADASVVVSYAIAALQNKTLGIAMRYAPQLVLAGFAGPVSVGVFDALSRIPYLAKALLGSATSAVLPAAARVLSGMPKQKLWERVSHATALIGVIFVPPLVCAAVFGDLILRIWLGPAFSAYWVYFALMMAWPASIACDQVRDSVLSVDRNYLRKTSLVSLVQLAVLLIVGLSTTGPLSERSFATGLFAASVVGLLMRWRISSAEGVPGFVTAGPVRGLVITVVVSSVLAAMHSFLIADQNAATGLDLIVLFVSIVICVATYTVWGMSRATRAAVLQILVSLLHRQRR